MPEIIRLAKYQRRKAFRYHDLKEDQEDTCTQTPSWPRKIQSGNNPVLHLPRAEKKNAACTHRSKGHIEGEVDDMAIDAAALSAFRRHHQRSCNHKDMVKVMDIVGRSIRVISVIADEILEHCQRTSLVEMVYCEAVPELAKHNVVPYQSI